jgi:glyoxylase-like metal-dependent hydrolase (beta-lactamase superfamily II)
VADARQRHPDNVEGTWFVDTTCIDCDAARQCAPAVFGVADDGLCVVVKQPGSPEEIAAATRALFACPTGSIGAPGVKLDPDVLPEELEDGVFYCGYNSRDSFGANAYFVRRDEGNLLVDSPRWTKHLRRRFEEMGGIARVLLTHRDDVAEAGRYAEHFGAKVYVHDADRGAAPFASEILRGGEPIEIVDGLTAIPVPGHTRGSVVYLLEARFLFTGDSLYWSRERGSLSAFRQQCWYSWPKQTESLARLCAHRFEWVLPGHGDRARRSAEEMRSDLEALVRDMRSGALRYSDW